MRLIKICAAIVMLLSSNVYAKSVSATGATLDEAESEIALLAEKEGANSYKIIHVRGDDYIYIVARLNK
ncbi:DUF1471 domain-containing protein [Brenneria populi]|uniref:DUF1471 domain-containing protein n=1 Tax=Brenneria populi TaxID=1505588 RepID=A0ABU6JQA5_9GAMM|nr:DUF1471 domain-containing protein [Brenneria populi Li et al. 2015]